MTTPAAHQTEPSYSLDVRVKLALVTEDRDKATDARDTWQAIAQTLAAENEALKGELVRLTSEPADDEVDAPA